MPTLPFPVDLYQFVVFLGGPLAVGLIVSHLLEKLPVWHKPPASLAKLEPYYPRIKAVFTFLLTQALPHVSALVLAYVTAEQFSQAQPTVNFLLSGLAVWFGVNEFHSMRPEDRAA